jgi:hypothetical protein
MRAREGGTHSPGIEPPPLREPSTPPKNRKRTYAVADRPYPISPNVPTADSHPLVNRLIFE